MIMVSLNRMKKRAILHGADVKKVEACKEKLDVEKVLKLFLEKKQGDNANGTSE